MASSDTASIIWFLAVLVLVGSALASRRLEWRSAVGMALTWAGVFAVVLVLVSYRQELSDVAERVTSDVMDKPRQSTDGKLLKIAISNDGHYWVEGSVNGTAARFLIDSGATFTALSIATVKIASVDIDTQRMPVTLNTANGSIEAQRGVVSRLELGSVVAHDLPVVVSPAFGEVNVIGMNLLARLKSWRVANGEMVLEP